MFSISESASNRHPIIGCTSYRRVINGPSSREIYGLTATYVQAIIAAGGIPLLIPIGLSEADMQAVFERIDGVLLPGGGDMDPGYYGDTVHHSSLRGLDTGRDELELFMARGSVDQQKPVLAICRGHQVFNVALGGTLWQDLAILHMDSQRANVVEHDNGRKFPRNHLPHTVNVKSGTSLSRYLSGTNAPVNSMHHQGIRDLAADLMVSAEAPDGLIEGVEVPGHPFAISVQWHPEDLIHDDPAMLALFQGLMEASSQQADYESVPSNQQELEREPIS